MMTVKSPDDRCGRCGKLREKVGALLHYKGAFVCDLCVRERNREALREFEEAVGKEGASAGFDNESDDGDFEFMDFDEDGEDEEFALSWSPNKLNLEKLDNLLRKSDVRKIEDLSKERIDPGAVILIPKAVAEQFCVIPLYREGKDLVVAFSDPNDEEALQEVRYFTGLNVNVVAADAMEIEKAIERYYEV